MRRPLVAMPKRFQGAVTSAVSCPRVATRVWILSHMRAIVAASAGGIIHTACTTAEPGESQGGCPCAVCTLGTTILPRLEAFPPLLS